MPKLKTYEQYSTKVFIHENLSPILSFHCAWDSRTDIKQTTELHEELEKHSIKNYAVKIPLQETQCDYGYYSIGGQIFRFAIKEYLKNIFN